MSSDNHLATFAREHARIAFHAAMQADAHDHAARQMASGVHPPEKAPLFEGMQHGELRPEAVQKVGAMIASAPPGMRGQAIAKAHDELSHWIQQHGRIVGPDGRVQIARNPEQAHSLAAGIINAEIGRHEKAAEDQRKAQQEAAADAEKVQAQAQKEAQRQSDQQQKDREKAGEPTIEQRAKTLLDTYPERDPVAVLQRNLGVNASDAQRLANHVRQNAPIEAAPKVGGKGHEAIEESKATIGKQIEALVRGTIKAVMLPADSRYVPKVPEGIRVVEVRGDAPGAGKWLYRADKLNAATIKEAARNGTHGALLGHVSTKEEVKASGNPVIVQARHPDGTVIQDSAVDGDKPGSVHAQAANLHERHPEAHIQAVAPHEALSERIAETSNEGEKQEVKTKDIFDQIQPDDKPARNEDATRQEPQSATENQSHPAGEVKPGTEPAKPAEASGPGPATPEMAKGARVKFTDRSGTERSGTVLYTDGRIARVKCDDKKSYSVAIGKLHQESGAAGFNEAALADAQRAASAKSTPSETQ